MMCLRGFRACAEQQWGQSISLLQLFILESCLVATMKVTGSCSGRLLWSALSPTSHRELVLCDAFSVLFSLSLGEFIFIILITLPLSVPGWLSGQHLIYSPGFSFSCVPSQASSQILRIFAHCNKT